MTTEVFQRLDELLGGIPRIGVVHVGAHRGQEVADYRRSGFDQIVLIEPNPALWPALDRLGVSEVHCCACGTPGPRPLRVTDWDERSSLLEPHDYPVVDVVIAECRPLSALQGGCNLAVIDVQGAELEVLESADLDRLDAVIVESTDTVRYSGASTTDDVANHLAAAGWSLIGRFGGGHSTGITDDLWRSPTCAS